MEKRSFRISLTHLRNGQIIYTTIMASGYTEARLLAEAMYDTNQWRIAILAG